MKNGESLAMQTPADIIEDFSSFSDDELSCV